VSLRNGNSFKKPQLIHAVVVQADPDRGTATVETMNGKSRRLRVPWHALVPHGPTLVRGMRVRLVMDESNEVAAVFLSDEDEE
jgi:hypothetical protein